MTVRYSIIRDEGTKPLLIRDLGPWDKHMSITNGAEDVVRRLVAAGRLPEGRRLFYYDSEGQLDEILVKDGKFAGFAPGPMRKGSVKE